MSNSTGLKNAYSILSNPVEHQQFCRRLTLTIRSPGNTSIDK